MKTLIKLQLLLLALLLPAAIHAQDVEVDGIYYNIYGNQATVTFIGDIFPEYFEYSGSIVIPNTITYNGITFSVSSIGDYAFAGCHDISSITIPSSVTSIGKGAFWECYGLTSITIPEGVTSISSGTFRDCSSLASISIPEGVTSIGQNAFSNCTQLLNVNISNLESWCNINFENAEANPLYCALHLFLNGTELTNLTIPSTVTSIKDYVFYNCSGLTSITLPEGVTNIGNYAFSRCSGLTSITLPAGVTNIGNYAFSGCSGLTSMTIPESVIAIGKNALSGCTIDTLSFNAISCGGFTSDSSHPFYNANISTIILGNDIQIIPAYFAYGLTQLKNLTISSSVTSIGNYAFEGCTSLNTLNYNAVSCTDFSSVASYRPFYNLNITTVNIGDSVQRIPAYFACGLTKLTSVTIGNSITSSGKNSFDGCSGLTKVDISDLAAWCRIIFENAAANPLNYAHHLYLNGSEVVDLTIPNTVAELGKYAFYNCTGLTSVCVPNSVTSIGGSAFYGCSGLTRVDISDLSAWCKTSFLGATANPLYYAQHLYLNNDEITNLEVPNDVVDIGDYTFYNCSLTTVKLHQSVASVGNQAFNNSPTIESVTCAAETPPSWNHIEMFTTNVYNHSPLYVPLGSERAYMSDQCWGQFATIIGKGIQNEVLAAGILLNQSQMNLHVGNTSQLIATVLPDSTTNKVVTWNSSDSNIATVSSDGTVTAIAPGTATITATTVDGSNLSASCLVTVIENQVNYDNYLSVSDTTVMHGETIVIPVKMTNEASIISFQTDIFLPEGLELLQEDGEYIIDPSSRMTRTHSIMSNAVSNGAVRVVCYSSNYKPFTGNSGDDLFYLTVKVADDAEGDYTIQLQNTLFTTSDFDELSAPTATANVNVKAYLLGDANNSGAVTVTDVVVTSQYILEMDPNPFIFEAADVNVDGNITVTDVSRIAWMVLNPSLNAPQLLRAPVLWNNVDLMHADGITLAAGETRRVSILLDNDMDYTAFQLDLELPSGLTASNFQLTDRASSHAFDVNVLQSGKIRALCYTPALTAISGHEGALLTFDVTATGAVKGDIAVDGIELVTPTCQTVNMDGFSIGVNNSSAVNELSTGKSIARVDYFNLAGQQIDRPDSGVTLVVTTYTDGTRTTTKVIR